MKEKLKSYNFWLSVISAILVALSAINGELNIPYIDKVLTAVLGVFAVSGIVSKPKTDEENSQDNGEENKTEE
ncbi:MAG: hypothetical protein ACI4MI_04575 [Christensenellales bacterium]